MHRHRDIVEDQIEYKMEDKTFNIEALELRQTMCYGLSVKQWGDAL